VAKLEATISGTPFKEKSFKMDSVPKMMMMLGMMVVFLAMIRQAL